VRAVVGYLRAHRGQRFASTIAVVPMSEAFVRNIEQFANDEPLTSFLFRRESVRMMSLLRSFRKREGVRYVGKAPEKARVMPSGAVAASPAGPIRGS